MACRSAWLSGRTEPLGRSSSSKGQDRELAIGVLLPVRLAGGPLRALPAQLLARSQLAGLFAGQLALVGAVGGPLLSLDTLDGRPGSLPSGPLGSVGRLGAEDPHPVGDAVGVSVLLDFGGGRAPGPPAPGRLRHRPQGLQDIAGAVLLDGQAGGAPLPGQGPNDLPILGAKLSVAFQPAVAALLVLAQLPLPVMGPGGLLGGHRQPTRHLGGPVATAAQEAKHAGGLAIGGRLVGGQGFLGLLAVGGGPFELAGAVAGA
jgi:hypothetical protein